MPNFRTAFPSKYLKAADLNGRPVVATIERVKLEDIGTGDNLERKFVVHWSEELKPVVLNLINSETIADLAGSGETEDWVGLRLELFPDKTLYAGKRVDCIRVRRPVASPKKIGKSSRPVPSSPDQIDEALPTLDADDFDEVAR